MSDAPILSRVVSAIDLPSAPVEMSASAAERSALAAANDLVSVDGLSATVDVERAPGGAVVVSGHVVADIVQTCVVSLAPVAAHIDEAFSVRYVRGGQGGSPEGEIIVDLEAVDPPEMLTGPTIDVGALVEEHFILAIDPYPRAPGAELPAEVPSGSAGDPSSPFAALAAFARKTKGFEQE
jgi:uncharacterized metal-binding protein YceD (DUF177 family)